MKPPQHISDWLKFNSFLSEQEIHLEEIINSLEGFHSTYEYQMVLHNFLQRYYLNFVSIKNIWGNFLKNSKFKFPVYLLLRSLIADNILMVYLIESLKFEKADNDEQGALRFKAHEVEFIERYIKASNPFFVKIEKEIKTKIATKEITPDEASELLKEEREKYPEQFEPGPKLKVKSMDGLGPGEMIKFLNKQGRSEFTGIYEYYLYFSQFEHFTAKTEEFMQRDRDDEFEHLKRAVELLLRGLELNLMTLQLPKDFIEKSKLLRASFINMFWPDDQNEMRTK